jgi:hypothetical protein
MIKNRLNFIEFHHKDKRGNKYSLYQCICGNKKVIRNSHVKNNATKSCGCLSKEIASKGLSKRLITHGKSQNNTTYKSWSAMKSRCSDKKLNHYPSYGGRGIKVCKRWLKFENFLKDIGERPKGKTLDRIDNNGNYEPSNCRWATLKEQNNNRRNNNFINYKGKRYTVKQLSEKFNIKWTTLKERLKRGWELKRALNPKLKINQYK